MIVDWIRCNGNKWCLLYEVDLQNEHFYNLEGVYIIFTKTGKVIRVGQGIIRNKIIYNRHDSAIQKYKESGLFVTWASVDGDNQNRSSIREGVETYLITKLKPAENNLNIDKNTSFINVNFPIGIKKNDIHTDQNLFSVDSGEGVVPDESINTFEFSAKWQKSDLEYIVIYTGIGLLTVCIMYILFLYF